MSVRDRIDPEVRAALDAYLEIVGPRGLSGIADLHLRRKTYDEMAVAAQGPDTFTGIELEDAVVAAGGVRVRIYRPVGLTRPLPGILYIRGGGLLIGSFDSDDAPAAAMARVQRAVVVAVDYRLAPEHQYPAAVDDCYAALTWLFEHSTELRVDPSMIAVYGTSAGGGLAAATTLMARDRGGPRVRWQMLVYPMLDDRSVTPSSHVNTGFGAWSREANLFAWRSYLGDAYGTDDVEPYAAVARAKDLAGLPPTYVDVGELDLFRDEDVDFAWRLMKADVDVELHVHPGGIHNGEGWAPTSEYGTRVLGYRRDAMWRALHAVDRSTSDR